MSKFEIKKDVLVKYIGNDEKIIIPENVKHINQCVFSNCLSLKEVLIPDNVISIGDFAFENCYNLTKVTIGQNVSKIGIRVFINCFSLTDIFYSGKNNYKKEYLSIPNNCEIHLNK